MESYNFIEDPCDYSGESASYSDSEKSISIKIPQISKDVNLLINLQ